MKRTAFIIALLSLTILAACKKQEEKQKEVTTYEIEQLLETATEKVEQEVTVVGHVTHTCKHSGKRCFIVGNTPNMTLRVEAKGEIQGFKSELIGSKIGVTGILKEKRLSKEYINQYEQEVKEKQVQEDGSAENCQAEMQNIQRMRDWMKTHNKDYYSVYYIDGQSYKVIEEE